MSVGYQVYGSVPEGWDKEGPDGAVTRYETVCLMMRKGLKSA